MHFKTLAVAIYPAIAVAQYSISYFNGLANGGEGDCNPDTNYAGCGDIAENVCCLASFTNSPLSVQGSNLDTTGVPDVVSLELQ